MTNLPLPPEFPASNASYNKIVGKMHKAALNAATATAAIAAVSMCKDAVRGTNTYAKASRRYADALIAALDESDGVGLLPPIEAIKTKPAAKAAVVEKPAMPQLTKLDIAIACGKSFSNKSNAKRALKQLALDHLPVEWQPGPNGVRPIVLVADDKGLAYAADRGIAAKVKA